LLLQAACRHDSAVVEMVANSLLKPGHRGGDCSISLDEPALDAAFALLEQLLHGRGGPRLQP